MKLQNMRASETTEQIKLFNWARVYEDIIPELRLLYHVPNEGKRSQSGGQILKAAGLKAGVPDVCLPVARRSFNSLYVEMKFGKNKPTKSQKDFMGALEKEGAKVAVCYSAEEAREMIRWYLSPADGFNLVNCEHAFRTVEGCEGVKADNAPCDKCKNFINAKAGKEKEQ